MECEVSNHKTKHEGTEDSESLELLGGQLNIATDKLLLTNFQDCFELCRHIVSAAKKLMVDADSDTAERFLKVQEAATAIGIQALAEKGDWRDVIPFVDEVYKHVAASPAQILHMCLLLHAHVREYLVCHSLMNAWLECDQHASLPESKAIVTSYITNVLVPLGAFNMIPQALERSTVFSSEERQQLLSPAAWSPSKGSESSTPTVARSESLVSGYFTSSDHILGSFFSPDHGAVCARLSPGMDEPQVSHQSLSSANNPQIQATDSGDQAKPKVIHKLLSLYMDLARRLWQRVAKRGWCSKIRKVTKLLLVVSFVLLAVLHVQTDVTTNFSRAMVLWKGAFKYLGTVLQWQPLQHLAVS